MSENYSNPPDDDSSQEYGYHGGPVKYDGYDTSGCLGCLKDLLIILIVLVGIFLFFYWITWLDSVPPPSR